MTHYPELLAAFKTAIEFSPHKRLDLVIPSAGISGQNFLEAAFPPDLDPEADLPEPSTKTLDINLNAVYQTAVLALHYFAKTRGNANLAKERPSPNSNGPTPHLLLIASVAGYFDGIPLGPTYSASKFGVRGMFKTLRAYGPRLGGVRINLLAPWFIDTAIASKVAGVLQGAGMKFGSVDDFVQGAFRLCCDDSIVGRSMFIGPARENEAAGSGNFDFCDDTEGLEGLREFGARLHTKLLYKTEEPLNVAKLFGYE